MGQHFVRLVVNLVGHILAPAAHSLQSLLGQGREINRGRGQNREQDQKIDPDRELRFEAESHGSFNLPQPVSTTSCWRRVFATRRPSAELGAGRNDSRLQQLPIYADQACERQILALPAARHVLRAGVSPRFSGLSVLKYTTPAKPTLLTLHSLRLANSEFFWDTSSPAA